MPVRKISAGYCNLTGKMPSKKIKRMIESESSLERDFLLLLEHDETVIDYEEQPIKIEFNQYSYVPDVLTKYDDGRCILYEVKYREDLSHNWLKLKPKFKAAIALCKKKEWRFKIITETEIRTPFLKNLEFLSHFSRTISQTESATRAVLIENLYKLNSATPRELLASCFSCKMKRAESAPVLWRLIFDKTISANLDIPLTMHTPLALSGDVLEAL